MDILLRISIHILNYILIGGIEMKDKVDTNKLNKTFSDMAQRGSLLTGPDVTQED